ncbi:hypothetical protein [Streptomyces sp. B6B3]|uniref:hypothetical protein n=1 Tax=Streptomyces sp. B6B3 TaxID=3153570 RepID=UPI00325DB2A1
MRVIGQVTSPGGQRLNEDRLGYAGRLAWVIDGATDLEKDVRLPAASDVQWLVDRLGERLTELGSHTGKEDVEGILRLLWERTRDDIVALGFPEGRIHPTCSVGLLLLGDDRWELARIGDPTCLAFGSRTVELSTDFFGRREEQAVREGRDGGPDRRENRRGIIERRQQYIEGRLGESVFSGHPDARLVIQSAKGSTREERHFLLCTDGFARAVVDYGLYAGWSDLKRDSLRRGLPSVVESLRQHEGSASDVTGVSKHFKRSDDATALLIET